MILFLYAINELCALIGITHNFKMFNTLEDYLHSFVRRPFDSIAGNPLINNKRNIDSVFTKAMEIGGG